MKSGSLKLLEPSGPLQGLLLLVIFLLTALSSMPVACLHTKLTPCSRLILDILTVSYVVNKFSPFYGNQRFITVFTTVRQLSIYWATLVQSTSSDPFLLHKHFNIILSSMHNHSKWHFSCRFLQQGTVYISSSPMRATCPTHPPLCYLFNDIW